MAEQELLLPLGEGWDEDNNVNPTLHAPAKAGEGKRKLRPKNLGKRQFNYPSLVLA